MLLCNSSPSNLWVIEVSSSSVTPSIPANSPWPSPAPGMSNRPSISLLGSSQSFQPPFPSGTGNSQAWPDSANVSFNFMYESGSIPVVSDDIFSWRSIMWFASAEFIASEFSSPESDLIISVISVATSSPAPSPEPVSASLIILSISWVTSAIWLSSKSVPKSS